MTSSLGQEIIGPAKSLIKSHRSTSVRWFEKDTSHDMRESFIGLGQFYSDKSTTTLNIGGLTFHPLHITLLNFTANVRQKLITSGLTIVAFLPTSFLENVYMSGTTKWISAVNLDRLDKLNMMNQTITKIVRSLDSSFYEGFPCRTVDGCNMQTHFTPSNYSSDIPEAKDMTLVKHGQLTLQPCHRCHIFNTRLNSTSSARPRTLLFTRKCLHFRQKGLLLSSRSRDEGLPSAKRQKTIAHLSTDLFSQLAGLPIFSGSPLFSGHDIVNPYQMFTVDPLHVFHLGISKMLKNSLYDYLKDKDRQSKTLGKDRAKYVFVSTFRLQILRCLNAFIDAVTCNSDGIRISCSISRDGGKNGLNGFFGEDSVAGMLEATHYKRIDNVSPFFGAMIDRCFDNLDTCPLTSLFTSYVLLLHKILYTPFSPSIDIISHARDIENDISVFKTLATDILGPYQTSGFGTVKFHLLQHIPCDIIRLGALSNCDTNPYELSHTLFKFIYNNFTNKRRGDSLENTIHYLSRAINYQVRSMQDMHRKTDDDERSVGTKKLVSESGMPTQVKPWFSISFQKFGSLLRGMQRDHGNTMKHSFLTSQFIKFLRHISDTATSTLMQCIAELLSERNTPHYLQHKMVLKFSRSFFLMNRSCPILTDVRNGRVYSYPSRNKNLRKVVAMHHYYGSDLGIHDIVFMRSADATENGQEKDEVWFGKVLCIVSLDPPPYNNGDSKNTCSLHNVQNCEKCNLVSLGTHVLVQYFDVITESELPVDKIDEKLNCIRLKWSRGHNDLQRDTDSGKEFGLCPITSILGVTHLAPATELLSLLNHNSGFKECIENNLGPSDRWEGELFYVNRFYKDFSED